MGDEGLANGAGHIIESEISGAPDKQSSADFRPGDMTWIKLRGGSWWPAQIVDENAVCDDFKPSKRKRGEVLVRLYGTYDYSYTNPVSSLLEFNDVLEQNKCTQREMFMKALEQKLSKLQSGRRNARRAKSKANGSVDNEKTSLSKRATEEQDALKKKSKLDDDTPQKPQASARRLKVMQDLGLTAPSGSPFLKNGALSLSP